MPTHKGKPLFIDDNHLAKRFSAMNELTLTLVIWGSPPPLKCGVTWKTLQVKILLFPPYVFLNFTLLQGKALGIGLHWGLSTYSKNLCLARMMVGQRFVIDSRNLQGIVSGRWPIRKPGPWAKVISRPRDGPQGYPTLTSMTRYNCTCLGSYAALDPGWESCWHGQPLL